MPEVQEQHNKKGVKTKTLFIRQLEMEYWDLIEELKKDCMSTKVATVIRYALKKAAGRL
jgi:hypothetical protein